MVSLMPLPEYKVGGPIDMSPLANALDQNARMAQQNYQFGEQNKLAQNHLALARNRDARETSLHGFQVAEAERQRDKADAKDWAAFYNHVKTRVPPEQQQAVWASRFSNPRFRDQQIPDEIRNFATAGPRLQAAAAEYLSPQELAQMGLVEANTANQWAQARAAGQKSQFDAAMAQLLGGIMNENGGGAAPPTPATPTPSAPVPNAVPQLQPQSYVPGRPQQPQMTPIQFGGGRPMSPGPSRPMRDTGTGQTLNPMPTQGSMPSGSTNALAPNMVSNAGQPQPRAPNALVAATTRDPNLILAQAGGAAAPAAPPPPPVMAPETYQTGLGPMTRDRAERLGMGLALAGKGDAGKMLMDSVQRGEMGKEGRNKLDKDLIDTAQRYHRLRAIQSSMKPEYLEIPFRVGMQWRGIKAKFGSLPKNEQGELYKYATFRRDAAQELNELVKERSGGAVTPQEFERQGVEIPNAGNGIFDGDDPVTFQAKFDRAYEVVALGMARNAYLRKANSRNAGATTAELARMMPIERFRAQVNHRAKQLEGQVLQQNPGLPKPIVDQEVDRLIKQEFGI